MSVRVSVSGITNLKSKLAAIQRRASALEAKWLVAPPGQRAAAKRALAAHVLQGRPLVLPAGVELLDERPDHGAEAALADL